jgi:hypothetical protein
MNKDIIIYMFLYIILYIGSKRFINYSREYFSGKSETLEIEVIVKITFNTLFKDNLKIEKIKNAYRNKEDKISRCDLLINASNKSMEETIEIHNIFFDKLNKNYDDTNKIMNFFKSKNKKKIDDYIKLTSDTKCNLKEKNNKRYKFKNNIISNNLALILLPIVL